MSKLAIAVIIAVCSLPAELRSISDSTVFKNKLKTYLFNMAFNVQ